MQPKRNRGHLQSVQTNDKSIPAGQPELIKNHRSFAAGQKLIRWNQEPLNDVQGHEWRVEIVQYFFILFLKAPS